jgi:hypothetical protein
VRCFGKHSRCAIAGGDRFHGWSSFR